MSFLDKLKKKISQVDYMAIPPQLKIEGKDGYQTPVGGFINIVLIILSIIGTVYFGQELWVKQNPNVVSSQTVNKQVGPFKIENNEFMVYTGFQFTNRTYFSDPRVITMKAYMGINQIKNNDSKFSTKEVEMGLCKNYYEQEDMNYDEFVDVDLFFCPKPDNITVEGFWGASFSSGLIIEIHKCVNTTENNNHCFSEEEIRNSIQGGFISMYATNSFLDMNDKNKPITYKLQEWLSSLNVDLTTSHYYKIKQLVFSDDKGFIIPTPVESRYPYFNSPNIMYYGVRGSLLAEIFVAGEKYGEKISRNYDKVQDVLTRIGGLIKAFTIIASIIAQLSSEFEYFSDTMFNLKYQLHNNINDSFNNKLSKKYSELTNSQNKIEINNNNVHCNRDINNNENYINKALKETQEYRDKSDKLSQRKSKINLANDNPINCNTEKSHLDSRSNIELVKRNNFMNQSQAIISPTKNKTTNKKIEVNTNITKKNISNIERSDNDDVRRNNLIPEVKQNNLNTNYVQNLFNFKKNILFINNCNDRLVDTTIPYYSFGSGCKDFFSQLFGFLRCRCGFNKRILTEKDNFLSKANKMLSINYLFKKLFLLEILTKRNFSESELDALHYPYINQLINRSNGESYVYDDSDAFDLKGLV